MYWHFYSTEEDELQGKAPHSKEGIAGFVFNANITINPELAPLYRFYINQGNGIHFYTLDRNGEAAKTIGYNFDKIQCLVPVRPSANTIPIYRFYNSFSGDHFYTADFNGEMALQSGYIREADQPVFYLYNRGVSGTVPLYRSCVNDTKTASPGKSTPWNQYGPQPPTGHPCPHTFYWNGVTCVP